MHDEMVDFPKFGHIWKMHIWVFDNTYWCLIIDQLPCTSFYLQILVPEIFISSAHGLRKQGIHVLDTNIRKNLQFAVNRDHIN